jgi:hypothetical protein
MPSPSQTRESIEDLIDKAWDSPTPATRARYARLALAADPGAIDAYVAVGSPEEAGAYVENNRDAWSAVPDALARLREAIANLRAKKAMKAPRPSRHWSVKHRISAR